MLIVIGLTLVVTLRDDFLKADNPPTGGERRAERADRRG